MRHPFRWGLAIGGLVLLVAAGLLMFRPQPPLHELLTAGRRALLKKDYAAAERCALGALRQDGDSVAALLLAGEAAAKREKYAEAVAFYERIPDDGSSNAVKARCAAGELLLRQFRHLSAAEQQFRRAVEQEPEHILANDRMAHILGLESRSGDMAPFQLALMRLGLTTPRRLYLLALGSELKTDVKLIREYHRAVPDDPGPALALGRLALLEHDYPRAERLLRQAVDSQPDSIAAQESLGRLLLESGNDSGFADWQRALPAAADERAGIWVVRGRKAQERNDRKGAVRCFWEAVRRDANHQRANYQLGQLLLSLGESERAAPYLERAAALQAYQNAAYVNRTRVDQSTMNAADLQSAAEQALALGLLWEAWGWTELLGQADPDSAWARQTLEQLAPRIEQLPAERAVASANPALGDDLSQYPLPDWAIGRGWPGLDRREAPVLPAFELEQGPGLRKDSSPGHPPQESREASVRFTEIAAAIGLKFSYFNASDPEIEGLSRMFEFTGGGVAVLDFDGDGWPDLYFTQGCRWPPHEGQNEHRDRLFRNVEGRACEEISADAGLFENRFSQGAAVGDFNQDGFPDLYVANIGGNRLYENNGDGTFSDVGTRAGISGDAWTSSCLMADLNGDAWPDIYAVNYLEGSDLFTRVCRDREGIKNSCLPQSFPAAQDRLYLNLGDGRFEESTHRAGILRDDGKGLGIVAADFDRSGRLSLFVANDSVANFFFKNETPDRGGALKFTEQALPAGLALNDEGHSEACMGVAAGDADGDGLVDLFVTNFTDESNTLYLQGSGGRGQESGGEGPDALLFRDATRLARLRDASTHLLGFGTQFLDADLDGRLDLIVANGHIDDYRAAGIAYAMPPQFFLNEGAGRFRELTGETLGDYFVERYLGRGLATLDWNRDGRTDAAVSHLDRPAALLLNESGPASLGVAGVDQREPPGSAPSGGSASKTPLRPQPPVAGSAGRYLAVQLRGTAADRDAIGATVTVQAGKRRWVRQLTAGDGYMASNQRQLTLGLGEVERVDSLSVRWPGGRVQEFTGLPVNAELLLVEGSRRWLELSR